MKNLKHALLISFVLSACQSADPLDADPDASVDGGPTDTGSDGSPGADAGPDVTTSDSGDWLAPDPEGRVTEGNLLEGPPEMVIITASALAPAWERLATYRSLTGVPTEVVTVETILAENEGRDDAERIRSYLAATHEDGLRFALIGGDAEIVPFRRIEQSYSIPFGDTYTSNGPCQLYYADLDLDWDRDGDDKIGEIGDDIVCADLRQPEIAVGRVPAGSQREVEQFIDKLERYEGSPESREAYPLILSDVAMNLPMIGEVDAAEALEVTMEQLFPESFKEKARRLYETQGAVDSFGGEVLTPGLVDQALSEGYLLTYHNGHGSHSSLTGALDLSFVSALSNPLPTVMVSCACLTGNFADIALYAWSDTWTVQGPQDDSAGELLIVGEHGGVGYLGSTATGLGAAGGSQILHAYFEGLFLEGHRRLGEALSYARPRMREVHISVRNIDMSVLVTDASERWTQLTTILFGDPAMPLWTGEHIEALLDSPESYGPGYNEMTLRVETTTGEPISGATITVHKADDFLLRQDTDADGAATFRFVPHERAELTVRVSGMNVLPLETTIAPR